MPGEDDDLIDITPEIEQEIPDNAPPPEDEGDETVIGFADDEGEDQEETPLIKRLREQYRELSRKLHSKAKTVETDDPEPQVLSRKRLEDFDYDSDRFDEYDEQREASLQAHADWRAREGARKESRDRARNEQSRQIEQQRRALGVSDYDDRAAIVQDRLNDAQIAVIINGADNPAQVIYALGRSQARLDMLAGEDNLAKFAVMLGKLEKDIKVTKRKPPAPESRVRGATASTAVTSTDKELERLDNEAVRTGDRSKIAAYRRELRKRAA